MKVWLVTGATRGFGRAIARRALDVGDAVVAGGRNPEALERALGTDEGRLATVALDVTDSAAARATVDVALSRFGRIDVLVNNAGRGIVGAVEEVSDAETRAVFEVNVFGALAMTRAVLPTMRAQRSGHVLMMSSMGGFTQPGSGWGVYGASKFALEGFSEALANEVGPLGVAVTLVEPGVFRTDFLDGTSLHVAATDIDDYADTAGRLRHGVAERNHNQEGDPARAAAVIVEIAGRSDAPLRLPLGEDAFAAIDAKLAAVAADVDGVRRLSSSTAHR